MSLLYSCLTAPLVYSTLPCIKCIYLMMSPRLKLNVQHLLIKLNLSKLYIYMFIVFRSSSFSPMEYLGETKSAESENTNGNSDISLLHRTITANHLLSSGWNKCIDISDTWSSQHFSQDMIRWEAALLRVGEVTRWRFASNPDNNLHNLIYYH